jgi:hypothetical protein
MEATAVTDGQQRVRECGNASRQGTLTEDVVSSFSAHCRAGQPALCTEGGGAPQLFRQSDGFGKMRESTEQLARRPARVVAPADGRVSGPTGPRHGSHASDATGPARTCLPVAKTTHGLLPSPDVGHRAPTTGRGPIRRSSNRRPSFARSTRGRWHMGKKDWRKCPRQLH